MEPDHPLFSPEPRVEREIWLVCLLAVGVCVLLAFAMNSAP
ncbi:MAG: hypothetical protein VKP72_03525 [bacterium]|jgi:hypothetical protein|nr:hypothetical protein [bacterium]